MNNLNKYQKIIFITTIISTFNIVLFIGIYLYIYKNNDIVYINIPKKYNINFTKDKYYVGLNEKINISTKNNSNIKYNLSIDDNNIAKIENNILTGLKYGKTELILTLPDNTVITKDIYVVKGMISKPIEFDYEKEYIGCNIFTNEENKLLDEALEDKIKEVTYKTRASVVEAARFLTLNFNYRIPYFYENGRLNNYGDKEHVDGEGRFYHKGLFLSESKYDELSATLYGPKMWGCPLTNITKANGYGYYIGSKYPNGLDCSGFVSWTLYNGGFDVKDTGAGETYRDDDLYDLGEKTPITLDLLNSNTIKVGDLIAYSGHMAIIIGIENEYIYVAESLPHLKGLVAKKYTKEQAKNTFTHIILMDKLYKNDGKLTNMWY